MKLRKVTVSDRQATVVKFGCIVECKRRAGMLEAIVYVLGGRDVTQLLSRPAHPMYGTHKGWQATRTNSICIDIKVSSPNMPTHKTAAKVAGS